ncbi:MAG: carbohydrate-binding protein [Treponema sp.]|nr:carbohydrate-binding protein [Treponema sp.]
MKTKNAFFAAVFAAAALTGMLTAMLFAPGRADAAENEKRGVSYSFESASDSEMALFAPSLKWFYNWGNGLSKTVDSAAKAHGLSYFPMAWNDVEEDILRYYKKNHPDCEYLLAYNEPNLTDQANMTPTQAAKKWKRLLKIAKELKLKIVAPAMNYGTLKDYGDPIKWLDEFFAKPGVSLKDVSAIAIHCYMKNPAAVKSYIDKFKKYGKPIWMTEFCAWDGGVASVDEQMAYMSETVVYMELDPAVERYAWFIPKGDEDETVVPYNKLITQSKPPALTPLGKVYAAMTRCDKTVYAAPGQTIEAEHFSDCNLSQSVNAEGFSRPVHFRPSTDADGGLDIFDFSDGKWVDYQIETAVDKPYTLSLRASAAQPTTLIISVDGGPAQSLALPQSAAWTTHTAPLPLAPGKHSLRLQVTSGNCAVNWIKVE